MTTREEFIQDIVKCLFARHEDLLEDAAETILELHMEVNELAREIEEVYDKVSILMEHNFQLNATINELKVKLAWKVDPP